MKTTKRRILGAVCVLFVIITAVAAYADSGYDTPTIPIHTKHYYSVLVSSTEPTCTEPGTGVYKCAKCTLTEERENAAPLGHMYKYDSQSKKISCIYCEDECSLSKSELEAFWSTQYINQTPKRTAKDNSGYLDLDGNGIINAKDYAILINL